MSIPSWSGARGLERLIWLKYDIVLKGQNTFNLGLNTAKNTHHMKKASNKSRLELNFVQKSSREHIVVVTKKNLLCVKLCILHFIA